MIFNLFVIVALFIGGSNVEAYTVKIEESAVVWTGSKVGGRHTGTIAVKEGTLELDGENIVGGRFIIDMSTIVNTDLSEEYAKKLIGHLKSDDFFGVEKFPTAELEISGVVPQGTDNYKVTGDITIKGITREIKFPVQTTRTDGIVQATAKITIDRSEFDVRYGSGSFFDGLGDKVIYDNFELDVVIVAVK